MHRAVVGQAVQAGVHGREAVVVGDDVLARAARERVCERAAAQRVVAGAAVERGREDERTAQAGAVAAELEVVRSGAAGHDQALGGVVDQVGRGVAVEIGAERAAGDDVVVIAETQRDGVGPGPETRRDGPEPAGHRVHELPGRHVDDEGVR